jgi:hypothetical protein
MKNNATIRHPIPTEPFAINIAMIQKSQHHLAKSKVGYWSHMCWAVSAGIKMIFVGLSSIIHGIVPGVFTGTAAKTIISFYHRRLKDHPNQEYQDYIKKCSTHCK